MPKGKRADGTSLGGSRSGGPQAAALGAAPLAEGEASRLVRVRCSEEALRWFEELSPSLRGHLVIAARRNR